MTNREQLHRIETLLNRLDAAVVTREPGNARSAEQFEGLRRQISLASKNHRAHVGHLLTLSDSIKRGGSLELISDRVSDFLSELGVTFIHEVTHEELFEIVETIESDTSSYEVLEPAVIEVLEEGHIQIYRKGKAKRLVGPEPSLLPSDDNALEAVTETTTSFSETTPSSRVQTLVVAVVALVIGVLFGSTVLNDGDSADVPVDTTVTTQVEPSTTSSPPSTEMSSSTTAPTTTTVSATSTTSGG